MGKVNFQYRGEGLYMADEKNWGDSYGDYYPAADYEALESKLSWLVEAAIDFVKSTKELKDAIEAAKGVP